MIEPIKSGKKIPAMLVSIVPLLLAVVAGHEEEQ
jgi:hypothetical protein